MLDTIISLAGLGMDAYNFVSNIRGGDNAHAVVSQLERLNTTIEKLSDHIYYAQNMQLVRDTSRDIQAVRTDLHEVRQLLEPAQRILGGDILSSAMIASPELLRTAMNNNPWQVLMNITPLSLAHRHPDPNMIPVVFAHENVQYVGWQIKGMLPVAFGMEYKDKVSQGTIQVPDRHLATPKSKISQSMSVSPDQPMQTISTPPNYFQTTSDTTKNIEPKNSEHVTSSAQLRSQSSTPSKPVQFSPKAQKDINTKTGGGATSPHSMSQQSIEHSVAQSANDKGKTKFVESGIDRKFTVSSLNDNPSKYRRYSIGSTTKKYSAGYSPAILKRIQLLSSATTAPPDNTAAKKRDDASGKFAQGCTVPPRVTQLFQGRIGEREL